MIELKNPARTSTSGVDASAPLTYLRNRVALKNCTLHSRETTVIARIGVL